MFLVHHPHIQGNARCLGCDQRLLRRSGKGSQLRRCKASAHRAPETIRIDYLPEQISFAQLLDIFLSSVDPFDPDGQYIDRGHSYTLAIYHQNEQQRAIAAQRIRQLAQESGRTVYISLEPFQNFYCAEEEHQDYYLKHPKEFQQELIDSGRITRMEG